MNAVVHEVSELAQLKAVAAQLKNQIQAGDVVYLVGDLGAGKTTFTQFFLQACGVTGAIKSPTYTLYETYMVQDKHYVHMDLYRLTDPEELYFIGIEDLLDGNNVLLVEWPNKGAGVMPEPDWLLEFTQNKQARNLKITSKH